MGKKPGFFKMIVDNMALCGLDIEFYAVLSGAIGPVLAGAVPPDGIS